MCLSTVPNQCALFVAKNPSHYFVKTWVLRVPGFVNVFSSLAMVVFDMFQSTIKLCKFIRSPHYSNLLLSQTYTHPHTHTVQSSMTNDGLIQDCCSITSTDTKTPLYECAVYLRSLTITVPVQLNQPLGSVHCPLQQPYLTMLRVYLVLHLHVQTETRLDTLLQIKEIL